MSGKELSDEKLRLMALELEDYEEGLVAKGHGPFVFDRSLIKVDKAFRHKIFELRSKGADVKTISSELGLSEIEVEVVIERDQAKIKKNQKWEECLRLYREGYTLEEIGEKVNLTRERVRQICNKQLAVELGFGPTEILYRKDEISAKYRSIVHESREERVEENVEEKLNEAFEKGIDPQYFDSLQKFTTATGISADNLQKFKPEVYKEILVNQRRRKQRWNQYYDACKMCGLTTNKHRSSGYCVKCYAKTPEWKEMVKLSYMRHKETRQLANKKFLKEYMSRPEVIERKDREYDEKYFGGNRRAALERDGYKCLGCGMSTEIKDNLGRQKVRVWHLNGESEDNALENLGTYCQSCLFKNNLGGNWRNFKRRNRSKRLP
jgi:DNA-binding CsgD family transcriptional regulator